MKADIERKVKQTIEKYKLLSKKDKVLVACSGGKDSTTVLFLLNKFGYDVEALFIDLFIGKYSEKNKEDVERFCSELGVKLHEVSVKDVVGYSVCYLKSVLKSKGCNLKSCAICGAVKRHILNRYAKRLKKTKLVTGHNLDDEAQSFVMNLLKDRMDLSLRLGPKTGVVEEKGFVPRVKPLYFCAEKDVEEFSRLMKFPVVYDSCPCSVDAFRRDVGRFLDKLERDAPGIKLRIVDYFLERMPRSKKRLGKLGYCENCGEPCSGKVCNVCGMVGLLGGKKRKVYK
ncbi:TIGR00269 family protein [Candidatus Woesearchaeota archaeon]|nr:TIGR00269 family protein [Candidatus Woesearchaeota archaeon]|tara:strand:- start:4953 stop:5807 length:855 start_codon:yes stop_codon:yes gene_type:complete